MQEPLRARAAYIGGALLVALVAVLLIARARNAPSEPVADPAFDPHTPDAQSPPSASASSTRTLAPITNQERRDAHVRIEHEICERGAKRVNELNQRNPTDPAAIGILSNCLKYGNVAWYKCVIGAQSADEVKTCSARFLRPEQYLDD